MGPGRHGLEVVLGQGTSAQVVLVVPVEDADVGGSVVVLVCIARARVLLAQRTRLVRVGRPVVRVTVRFEVGGNRGVVRVVCRHRDVIEVCPLGIEASASVGLLSCQTDRDQIETRFVEGDAAGAGDVQGDHAVRRAAIGGARGAGDHCSGGLGGVLGDQADQLIEAFPSCRVSGGRVHEQQSCWPGVVVEVAGAGGGDVGVVCAGAGNAGLSCSEGVVDERLEFFCSIPASQPVVHGRYFGGDPDACRGDARRPRIDGDLCCEVPHQVPGVVVVA